MSEGAIQKRNVYSIKEKIGLIGAAIVLISMQIIPGPADLSQTGWKVLSIIIPMVLLWVTEAIPIYMTAVLPTVLSPFIGLGGLKVTEEGINIFYGFGQYNSINMFFVVFFSATIIKSGLHKRIALNILALFGGKPKMLLLGVAVATATISAFSANVIVVSMLLPIAMALCISMNLDADSGFAKAALLMLTFAATLGGLISPMGSGSNWSAIALVKELTGIEITFLDWMLIGAPFAIVAILLIWAAYCWFYRVKDVQIGSVAYIRDEIQKLGPMSRSEKIVGVCFAACVFFIVTNTWILKKIFPLTSATMMFQLATLVVMVVVDKDGTRLLDTPTIKKSAWEMYLLVAGGLTMADMFVKGGVSDWICAQMTFLIGKNSLLIVIIMMVIVSLVTEFCSNQVAMLAFLPIASSLSDMLGIEPLFLMFVVISSANFSFCLPSATPTNAISLGSGFLKTKDMMIGGLIAKIICMVLFPIIFLTVCSWLSPLF